MFLPNPKWDAIRTRSRSFYVAKTFPNNPLRNLRYFDFAPDNHIYSGGALRDDTKNGCVADYHIYGCNVIQVRTKFMKIAFNWLAKVLSNTTELEWVRRYVMSSTVFHQPPLPTGAARCVLFSQISSEMRLLIVSNCSLLLQLSLDFILSTLFSPYWTGQLFYLGVFSCKLVLKYKKFISHKI